MNLDTLVSTGQPPWQPSAAAHDTDAWDKYDFAICGTYRLGGDLVVFTIITAAGNRSLWAYVPIPPDAQEAVTGARFDTEAEFSAFLEGLFAGREAVFAGAENFVITSKSDGIHIPTARHALLAAGARWYTARAAAIAGHTQRVPDDADPGELLRATQSALAAQSA